MDKGRWGGWRVKLIFFANYELDFFANYELDWER